MKKVLFIILMFSAVSSFAQKDKKIILKKGQKITVVSLSNADLDMGMGMQAKSTAASTNELTVISEDDKNYSISNKVTKLSISSPNETGGQTTLDSEKPEDRNSETGKEIFSKLNVADTLFVDKVSANISENQKESPERPEKDKDDANSLMGMMEAGMGAANSKIVLNGAFFIISKERKVGDSWSDSSSEKNIVTKRTYTIKSIDKDIATIIVTGTVIGNGDTEINGTSVSFTMDTKNTGETIVDTKTSLVSKTTNDADITMTIDLMGQSMPITSKASSTVTYQY